MFLHQRGARLISYDRPGYGGSDRMPRRRVADVAQDVADVADALELDRFAVAAAPPEPRTPWPAPRCCPTG